MSSASRGFTFWLYKLPEDQIIRRYINTCYHANDIQSETLYIVFYIVYFKYLLKEFKLLHKTFLHVNTDKRETMIIAPDREILEIRGYIFF